VAPLAVQAQCHLTWKKHTPIVTKRFFYKKQQSNTVEEGKATAKMPAIVKCLIDTFDHNLIFKT
jgi:hypothetical protein